MAIQSTARVPFCGVWERQIGTIWRILDAMPLETSTETDPRATRYPDVRGYRHSQLPSYNSHTIRHRQTSPFDTIYVADSKDSATWSPPRHVRVTGCLCSPEMEKGTIPGGPVLDEVETRIHPELTTEDKVEPGALQPISR